MSTPQQIGRYQIRHRIGSGGFATVWLAYDTELLGDVAVKILAENWLERTDIQERFLEEARILRRADADGVVRVYDIGRLEDGRPYFVMSYADRGTLADVLAAGQLPVGQALHYAVEAAHGVAVLHDVGVIHRDIKPSNVLVRSGRSGDRLVIADLGLAKEFAHASGFTVAAGTPGYMSPEQATVGGGLDQRSDVYSLGALTYQLLTGRKPESALQGSAVVPPSQVRPDLPPAVDAVVMRAIARDRQARWPDARSFADGLGEVLTALPNVPQPTASQPPQSQAPPPGYVQPGFAPPTVMGGGQPATAGPLSPTPHPTYTGGRRAGARRPLFIALAAGCAVVLAAVAGLLYWQLAPVTITSKDGAVSADIPRGWDKDDRSQILEESYDYGLSGSSATKLESGRTALTDVGITIVASRGFGNEDPSELLQFSPFPDAPTENCDDALEDMFPPNGEFQAGEVWTYPASCGKNHRYGVAALTGTDKKYGAYVFLTGDPAEFDTVLNSIDIEQAKLP
ncbi:MAG: protein kinase [Streptosporangiales bacterium]|nr:protein kinase [Streptosporangiales bacterium]